MKILYAIQGTGHGHISRAREIVPALKKEYDIDLLVSGYNSKLSLDYPINFTCKGISFIYGHGGISWSKSMRELDLITYLKDTVQLNIKKYDLVISDFEPVSAWAAKIKNIPSLSMSHQSAFNSSKTPRPHSKSIAAEFIMKHYAPCDQSIGFHFESYDDFILPPIIREEVRNLNPYYGNHISVYLPAFQDDVLIKLFGCFPQMEWHIFSSSTKQNQQIGNCSLIPINNTLFLESIESSDGLITSSGFEACAEAMFLQKKLLTIPIQHQYEQYCNAAALKKLGVTIVSKVNETIQETIIQWLEDDEIIPLKSYSTAKDVLYRMNVLLNN